ncbi:MAG: DedA family protein [Candidatus Omnitrophica bacterium]|nr:DedA family protein [Candidatus Omnitrophota bacterium]
MTETIPPFITELISKHGDLGTFIAMFLESSVVPIPSELVIAGAGAIGVPLWSIVIFGTLGSTLGAMVGYAIGRFAGLPVIIKFGKYVFIKPHHIEKAEAFAQKHGVWSVLLGRLLPIIPFKVFSIAAGLTKIPFVPFVVCTFIGVVPRLILLGLVGAMAMRYIKVACIGAVIVVAAYLVFHWWKKRGAV